MTIDNARLQLLHEAKRVYDEHEASVIVDLILEYVTGLQRTDRIKRKYAVLTSKQLENLDNSIERLLNHEPVQYITSEAWFAGMKFHVDPRVLIPRPETEELVQWIVKDFEKTAPVSVAPGLRLLDVGTGSGCIAISIKNKMPAMEVWGCDVSLEALSVARLNADELNAAVDFVPLDFLNQDQWRQLPPVDAIVSNPPYVPLYEKEDLAENVVGYEPHLSLFVSHDDPLIFYRAVLDFAEEKLRRPGSIYVETHEKHGQKVMELFEARRYAAELRNDLSGKERMVRGIRK